MDSCSPKSTSEAGVGKVSEFGPEIHMGRLDIFQDLVPKLKPQGQGCSPRGKCCQASCAIEG